MNVELTKDWCMNMAKIEARAAELHEGCRMPMEQARELAASEARPDWYARGQDWGLADALTNGQSGEWVLDDIARAFAAGAAVAYAHGAAVVDKCNGYIVDNARLAEEVDRLREALTRGEAQYPDMQRDAERYRWLRLQDWDTSRLAVVANPRAALKLGHDAPSRDRLDAMIDVHLAEVQGFLDHTLDGLDLGPNVPMSRTQQHETKHG